MAPEVVHFSYDEKCDIWSAGVVLYVCVIGGLPFGGKTEEEIFNSIKGGLRGFPSMSFHIFGMQLRGFKNKRGVQRFD